MKKFNGDYGGGIPPVASSEPHAEIDKQGNVSVLPGEVIEYTIPVQNNGDADAGLPLMGMPLVLSDTVPMSTIFVAGSFAGSEVQVYYSIDDGLSWTTTESAPPSPITNVQFWFSDTLAPGAGNTITFAVQVDPGKEVTSVIEATNRGKHAAIDVVITDVLSEYLEIIQVTTTGHEVRVEAGVIGPGFVVEVVIQARIKEDVLVPLTIENVARLYSPNGGERFSIPITVSVPDPLVPETGDTRPQ